MEQLRISILRIDSDIELPRYAYPGDAGLDLAASIDLILLPFERALIPTGIALAIPDGYAGLIQPRSGIAMRYGLSMVNTPGLIDSQYRGEIKIAAINLDPNEPITVKRGDRIGQLVIISVPSVTLQEVETLDATSRGEGGFGSSGGLREH
jgi:dUTP pyrophosphatase